MSIQTQEVTTSLHWAAEELATATFGDQRLRARFIQIVAAKLANPTATIPHASGNWAATKATYNFFASQQVCADAIRAAHLDATRTRLANHHTVLVVQDTTELDYSSHRHTSGLGYLDNAYLNGLKVHSALAVTPTGVPLGMVYQTVWSRDAATKGHKRRMLPQEQRESQRWLTTLEQVQQTIAAPTRLIVVADREADIYPLFIAPRDQRTELVIRAAYNRGVSGGQKVEDIVEQLAWQGTYTVELAASHQRAARKATLQIGWSRVEVQPPTDYSKRASAPRPNLHLVVVEEQQQPAGVKPLRWLLWTTMEVSSWDEAVEVVEIYKKRWLIERSLCAEKRVWD